MRIIDADALVWKIMTLCRSYQKTHLVHAEMLEHFTNSILAYIDHAEEHKTEVKVIQYDSNLSAEPKWIPCSDRLPYEHICDDGYVEPSEKVLVCTDAGTILTSRYWGNRQSKAEEPDTYADWVDIDWWHNVIAWMPLPEPYRKDGE